MQRAPRDPATSSPTPTPTPRYPPLSLPDHRTRLGAASAGDLTEHTRSVFALAFALAFAVGVDRGRR
ncbi:hypothetical protein [Actinomadura welshii]|uniref:hypothetical protein n=1 Tax=Actinomadura welshii TaxID=3103817 RepID=UPI0012684DE3|nr:hypothetical protein [Actinomadura madurae]